MSFTDAIKKSVLEGFSFEDITTTKILVTLFIAFIISIYIHLIYRIITRKAFYSKNYGVSMVVMSVITSGIILAMQSSLVISLGMVGALSIVRFRTAIKDPKDLLFLFWSMGNGIICGAGLYEIAILVSVVATVGIFIFDTLPNKMKTYLLVVNINTNDSFDKVITIIKNNTKYCNLKAKNISHNSTELILEIKLKTDDNLLIEELGKLNEIDSVNLLNNEVDVKF